jgi:hypothetical protein
VPPSASSQGERAPRQRQKNHSPGTAITPYRDTGFRKVIPAPVTKMIAALGAPLLAAEARHRRGQNPGMAPGLSAGTDTRTPQADGAPRYLPSQHDSDLPAELVTLIDLLCTPEVPGIHLPWTCAAPGESQRPRRRIRF